jgi:mannose-6-phosphate isomerase-like protein (cupin superfamily)
MEERLAVDPVFGMRSRFWRTTGEDGGEVQHVETWVDPGGGVTAHVHPSMHERFVVHEGRCQFLHGRKWIEKGPGEAVDVPAGTRHAFRNRGDAVTRIECEARPPSSLQAFLEDAAGLSRAGKLTKIGLPTPGGLLETAVLVERYSDMVVLGFPAPPRPIQRLIFAPLARIAERRGHRAGQFAKLA